MKIVITGGTGFLGNHLQEELKSRGYDNVVVLGIEDGDLTRSDDLSLLEKADVVFHLAAYVGGIRSNIKDPANFFLNNALMGLNIVDLCRSHKVKKFIYVGSVCSYPDNISVPFKEEDFWNGYPEESNSAYGMGKKMVLPLMLALRKQYGFNGVYPVLTNLYGQGDRSDHVIPDLIKKFTRANGDIVLWGSGKQTRDFLYVKDAARGLVDVMEKYDDPEPINLSTGKETSIKELAKTIARLTNFKGNIHWDTSKPEGSSRRVVNPEKAKRVLGWESTYSLEEGLKTLI